MSDTHSAAELPVRASRIRLAIFDVDGVLTDGKLYFLVDGSEFKTFNTLDGHGIKMLIASGVRTAIITGRDTPVVERRAQPGHPAPLSGPGRQARRPRRTSRRTRTRL
ncbi:hypothetical protein PALA46_00097 [Pseudomonas aeruginosa]|nr:hypothetical protein [Pseudomonas aeruginosa]